MADMSIKNNMPFIQRKLPNRCVLLIDRLDYVSLFIAMLIKFFVSEVYFFHAKPAFRADEAIRLLKRIGINWINYSDLDGGALMGGYEMQFQLDEQTLQDRLCKSSIYHRIVKQFSLDQTGVQKLDAALRWHLIQHSGLGGVKSINLARRVLLTKNTKVVFFPAQISDCLLLSQLRDESITIVNWHCVLKELIMRIYQVTYSLTTQLRKLGHSLVKLSMMKKVASGPVESHESIADPDQFLQNEIAFFPHKNLYYGKFFRKTYLYDDAPDSPLYREKVLTLFYGKPDTVSARYLRMFKIPFTDVASLVNKRRVLIECLRILFAKQKWQIIRECFLHQGALPFIFLARFLYAYMCSLSILDRLPSLRVVYVHYDVLFPQEFILACHQRSIETVSAQTRMAHHNYFGSLSYDHYLIGGSGFKQKLLKCHDNCRNYFAIGLPRSIYISRPKNLVRYQKYVAIKKTNMLVVCYGLFPLERFDSGISGQSGTSEASNLEYLRVIGRMAEAYPDAYFVVRFKNTEHLKRVPYRELVARLEQGGNVEVTCRLEWQSSYKMAYLADLIIGKQTMMMEEAFAAGKQVIFYDPEGWMQALDHPLNEIDVVAQDYRDLHEKFDAFQRGDQYFNLERAENIRNQYYSCDFSSLDGFSLIRQIVTQIYYRKTSTQQNGLLLGVSPNTTSMASQ